MFALLKIIKIKKFVVLVTSSPRIDQLALIILRMLVLSQGTTGLIFALTPRSGVPARSDLVSINVTRSTSVDQISIN